MTRRRLQFTTTAVLALIISLIFLTQMLMVGQSILMSLMIASMMGLLTIGIATMSYGYKEFLQRRSFAGKKQAGQSIENHQQRTVEIDVPMEVAFDLAMDALETLDNQRLPLPDDILVKLDMMLPRTQHLKIRETDKTNGIIEAGLRGKAIGIPELIDFSRINVKLEKVDSQTTRVHIDSKANTLMDTYDLGKNLHYVNTIALYLRRESQHLTAESRLGDVQTIDLQDNDEHDLSQHSQSDRDEN